MQNQENPTHVQRLHEVELLTYTNASYADICMSISTMKLAGNFFSKVSVEPFVSTNGKDAMPVTCGDCVYYFETIEEINAEMLTQLQGKLEFNECNGKAVLSHAYDLTPTKPKAIFYFDLPSIEHLLGRADKEKTVVANKAPVRCATDPFGTYSFNDVFNSVKYKGDHPMKVGRETVFLKAVFVRLIERNTTEGQCVKKINFVYEGDNCYLSCTESFGNGFYVAFIKPTTVPQELIASIAA